MGGRRNRGQSTRHTRHTTTHTPFRTTPLACSQYGKVLTRVPAAPWVGSQNSLSPRLVFKKASIAAVCASFSATISLVAQRKQSVETRRARRAPAACRFARSLASSFHMKRNFSDFLGSVETYRHSIQGKSPSTQSPSCIPFTRLHSVPHGSPGLVSRVPKHNCRAEQGKTMFQI